MSAVATAIISSAVVGGVTADRAASKANKASRRATDQTVAEQRRQYDQTRADYAPYREAGEGALNMLADPRANFETSPGYEFARSEGTRDVGNFFSARNSGGNAMRALNEFNTGLAQQDYGNWWNRQMGLVHAGSGATGGTAAAGQNMANMNTMAYQNHGANVANNAMTRYSGINNAAQGLAGNYMYARDRGWLGNNVNKPAGDPSAMGPPGPPNSSGGDYSVREPGWNTPFW